ncbi:hypothetical protein CDL15_Pgr009584 [Punica granatum]|uniref:Uncharacterized protein n=1 Tax=Punica granatum TaxID=22663 RepID=A0A218WTW1_PUNGR|nr:hypothetical protein CDL15_Pgr009584 [Punica granatum]
MYEWERHGTCSDAVLKEHDYFEAGVDLKDRFSLRDILSGGGIVADGSSYNVEQIWDAINHMTRYKSWIECNTNKSGNSQFYQVCMCVDKSGHNFIDCPVFPKGALSVSSSLPSRTS